jgi:transposase-like protein
MMKKQFAPREKAAVALEALKEQKTISQISSVYQVHPTQIGLWKKQAREGLADIFSDKRRKENKTQDQMIDELYKLVGQRDAELAWLKKKLEPFNTR